jgi:galactokinase
MNINDFFNNTFSQNPSANGTAPGRVNLIGEHIDYNGGIVLPTALKNEIQVAISTNSADMVKIHSTRFDETIERHIESAASGEWSDYIIGTLQYAYKKDWITGGINIAIESNIPDGAGVSSSAALITAIFRAINQFAQLDLQPKEIAHMARSIENNYCGMPCGIMDQMAVNLATFGEALALNTINDETEIVAIPDGWQFFVIHSGIQRRLTDGRYEERFLECEKIKDEFGTQDLCLINQEQLKNTLTLTINLSKRLKHIMSEHQRVLDAIAAMKTSDIERFGCLMNASHRSYSEDFEASTTEIDKLIQNARDTGAIGARLTGGGFGGCIVCLLPKPTAKEWLDDFLNRHKETWLV